MLRVAAVVATLAAVAAAPARAVPAARLPAGATIAGIAVGGLGPIEAKRTVSGSLAPLYETRPIAVRVKHKDTLVMPSAAGLVVYYDWMVKRAFALAGAHKPVAVPLHLGVQNATRDAAIASVAKRYYRAPRDARVRFGVTAVRRIRARMGHALDAA